MQWKALTSWVTGVGFGSIPGVQGLTALLLTGDEEQAAIIT